MSYHTPVLLKEVIQLLNLKPNNNVVDCTLGGGGHTKAMLRAVGKSGKVLAIDADKNAIEEIKNQKSKIKNFGNLILVQDNFRNFAKIIKKNKFKNIKAVLLDLGLSSYQLDKSKRGFSFRKKTKLNMSFSSKEGGITSEDGDITAEKIINSYPKQKLKEVLKSYGEIKHSGAIARKIDCARKKNRITDTSMLVKAVISPPFVKGGDHQRIFTRPQIKLLTKIWQALRIETNQELESLKSVLPQIVDFLSPGGRLAVISYHSLEDRIVKHFFKKEALSCVCPRELPVCACQQNPRLNIITKKVIVPAQEEVSKNSRARSAKLRVSEKI